MRAMPNSWHDRGPGKGMLPDNGLALLFMIGDEGAQRKLLERRSSPQEQGINRGASAAKFGYSLRADSEL